MGVQQGSRCKGGADWAGYVSLSDGLDIRNWSTFSIT